MFDLVRIWVWLVAFFVADLLRRLFSLNLNFHSFCYLLLLTYYHYHVYVRDHRIGLIAIGLNFIAASTPSVCTLAWHSSPVYNYYSSRGTTQTDTLYSERYFGMFSWYKYLIVNLVFSHFSFGVGIFF